MMREYHVRFWESAGAKFPRATHLFVRVNGKLRYLWRAVDHEGEVLEAVVTSKRDKAPAAWAYPHDGQVVGCDLSGKHIIIQLRPHSRPFYSRCLEILVRCGRE
jgi:DDE domain